MGDPQDTGPDQDRAEWQSGTSHGRLPNLLTNESKRHYRPLSSVQYSHPRRAYVPKSSNHPCVGGCGQMVSGTRLACLACFTDALKREVPEGEPVPSSAALTSLVLDHPEFNRR